MARAIISIFLSIMPYCMEVQMLSPFPSLHTRKSASFQSERSISGKPSLPRCAAVNSMALFRC